MTKTMIMKSLLMVFIISNFSCSKKDTPKPKAQPGSQEKATQPAPATVQPEKNTVSASAPKAIEQSADNTFAKPSSTDISIAVSTDSTKIASSEAVPQKPDLKKTVIISEKVSQDDTKPQVVNPIIDATPAPGKKVGLNKVATKKQDVQIKAEAVKKTDQGKQISDDEVKAVLKIKVLNKEFMSGLIHNNNQVLYKSQLTDLNDALINLKKGNEDSFCSISGDILFTDQQMISVISLDQKVIDKEFDIFETKITLKSQNKTGYLNCTHTTNNFYLEQFAINFSKYLEVYNAEVKLETASFVHPRLLNRKLNTAQIKNLKMFQEASAKKDRRALVSGRLVSELEALELIKSGKERTTCVISEASKDLDVSKVYLRVDKIMGPDNYEEVIEQRTVYRADKDNYFVFQCIMTKTTSVWYDIMKVADGVLEFGMLDRNEYNKKYDEIKAMNDELKKAN